MVTSLHLKVIVIGVGTCTLPGGGANDKLQEKVLLKIHSYTAESLRLNQSNS